MSTNYRSGFYLLLIAASSGAGTIVLKDSTRAVVTIEDTVGCSVVLKYEERNVRIDKNKVRQLITGDDTVYFTTGKCRDTGRRNPGLQPTLSINNALRKIISGYAVEKTRIECGKGIAYRKKPLTAISGADDKTVIAFSDKMIAFLKKCGSLRSISEEGMYFYLSGDTVLNNDCRYLAAPVEISIRSKERRTSISGFVKLDNAGNFVPAKTDATFKARESETIVRFIVIDLMNRKVVFDERLEDVDKGFLEPGSEKSEDKQPGSVNNSILSIESGIEDLLKKQIK